MLLDKFRWIPTFYFEGESGAGAGASGGVATSGSSLGGSAPAGESPPPSSGAPSTTDGVVADDIEDDGYFGDGTAGETGIEVPDPQSATPAPAAAAAAGFTGQHYAYGYALGLDQKAVDAFGTPQAFEQFAQRVDQHLQIQSQRAQAARDQQWQQHLAAQQQRQPAPVQQPGQQPVDPFSPFKFENPDDYDPGLRAFVDRHNQQIAALKTHFEQQLAPLGQLQQMQGQFEQMQRGMQQQHFAQIRQQVDSAMETLDAELFGKGDQAKWSPQELQNRMAMADVLARLEAGYNARGEALPPLAQLVEHAHKMLFADKIVERKLANVQKKGNRLNGIATHRPTSTKPQEERDSRKAAINAVSAKMREYGHGAVQNDDDDQFV